MIQTFLLPKARCVKTGQTVKQQDLTGGRFTHTQRVFAQDAANTLAAQMSARTSNQWIAIVEEYTPTVRR